MLMKNYILFQYIIRIFIILFILRQLLAVQWKQFVRFPPNLGIRLTTFYHCGDDISADKTAADKLLN